MDSSRRRTSYKSLLQIDEPPVGLLRRSPSNVQAHAEDAIANWCPLWRNDVTFTIFFLFTLSMVWLAPRTAGSRDFQKVQRAGREPGDHSFRL